MTQNDEAPYETVGALINACTSGLKEAGIDSSRLDARLLVTSVLGITLEQAFAYPEREVFSYEVDDVMGLMERRMRREPMSQILGKREFWSLNFHVSKDTLTPRPDTECLIETVLKAIKTTGLPEDGEGLDVLDLGTGSGCILLTLLSELTAATGLGVDISAEALDIAKQNTSALELTGRARFQTGRWMENVQGRFNVVVANPPYIPSADIAELSADVKDYEPMLALDGGEDGLDAYRDIIAGLPQVLSSKWIVAFEVGIYQATDVAALMTASGYVNVQQEADFSGIARVVWASSIE